MTRPVMNTHSPEEVWSEEPPYSLTGGSGPETTAVSGNALLMSGSFGSVLPGTKKISVLNHHFF